MLRVIRQCHHPAHNGDFFTRCGFILEETDKSVTAETVAGIKLLPVKVVQTYSLAWNSKYTSNTLPDLLMNILLLVLEQIESLHVFFQCLLKILLQSTEELILKA